MIKEITSVNNPLIKEIFSLKEKARDRKKSGLFIIEGLREITLAIKGEYTHVKILFCKTILESSKITQLDKGDAELFNISQEVYNKLAHRGSTEGILAVVKSKDLSLNSLILKRKNPLILVAETPEKPGNIGALLRTVDAANLDAVLIANPKTDLFNPNIIRSSVGCIFTTNIATGSNQEIIDYLQKNKIDIICAEVSASKPYDQINYTTSMAIVVGTEATGLTEAWLKAATNKIVIPMAGQIDSLNVSVSAAIIIFEALRQRNND